MPEVTPPTLWESYKAYIRGILMEMGAQRKKESRERLNSLLKEIQDLEQQSRLKGIPEKQEY